LERDVFDVALYREIIMGMQVANIVIPYKELNMSCEEHHVRKMALFGSVLRSDFRPESDVDVLVEYDPGTRVSILDMVDLQFKLEELFGHKVDLGTPSSLSKYIRNAVLDSAQVIYERT
jgi:predicted nucleotidyltransferase